MSTRLVAQECIPCRGGIPPLRGAELAQLAEELGSDWDIIDEHHLEKEFAFPDFVTALAFVNRVGNLAEEQNHHPDLMLSWGRAMVRIWTHKIDGLTESDFVFAAKAEKLFEETS